MDGDRQVGHARELLREYPRALAQAETFRRGRGVDLPTWPDWCFLPMGGFAAIVQPTGMLTPQTIPALARAAALVPWHYNRGIYRFDSRLADALLRSPIEDHLPVEVFFRLPEWSIYVEMPARHPGFLGEVLRGFYAHLEHDANTGKPELRFLLDEDTGLHALMLHLGDWSVLEAMVRTADETARHSRTAGVAIPDQIGPGIVAATDQIAPLVSLLLYLCSRDPDITHPRRPGQRPRRPRPTKTNAGWRLFPPDRVTIWQVGSNLGAHLDPAAGGFWFGIPGDRYEYRWTSSAGIA